MWDLSSPTRDQTQVPVLEAGVLTTGLPGMSLSYSVDGSFSSVAQPYPALWDPIDCSTPGLPVHYQLPELTQIHVH